MTGTIQPQPPREDAARAVREVDPEQAFDLVSPTPVLLLTTGGTFAPDIAPVTWATPLSVEPPLVGVALTPRSANYKSLSVSGEFALNVVGPGRAAAIEVCGSRHGHGRQKLAESGIELAPGEQVNAPHVADALTWIECMVEDLVDVGGDHRLVVGGVVAAWTRCPEPAPGRPLSPQTLLCAGRGVYGASGAFDALAGGAGAGRREG